jgi:hypothetical protein
MTVTSVLLVLITGWPASDAQAQAGHRAEMTRLSGEQSEGVLRSITESTVTIDGDDGAQEIPIRDLLDVQLVRPTALQSTGQITFRVELTDGSVLTCSQITTSKDAVTLESPAVGSISLPALAVRDVRLGREDAAVSEAWRDLTTRDRNTDSLIVRKDNNGTPVLDRIDGVVGAIDERSVKFLYDGDEISVNREKLFGIVYYRRNSGRGTTSAYCRIVLDGDDLVLAKTVIFDGKRIQAEMSAGSIVSISPDHVRQLDFSSSKVTYLSAMEPREVKYTPYFDVVWEYRSDTNLDGGPLRLGKKTYSRGLSIHSKTFLRYRLAAEYRRLQAIMGIDRLITNRNLGNVHVVISGDGKTLLETDVRGTDKPRFVDLDVKGIRDLGILVDFGEDLDIADHLDLANARVIK